MGRPQMPTAAGRRLHDYPFLTIVPKMASDTSSPGANTTRCTASKGGAVWVAAEKQRAHLICVHCCGLQCHRPLCPSAPPLTRNLFVRCHWHAGWACDKNPAIGKVLKHATVVQPDAGLPCRARTALGDSSNRQVPRIPSAFKSGNPNWKVPRCVGNNTIYKVQLPCAHGLRAAGMDNFRSRSQASPTCLGHRELWCKTPKTSAASAGGPRLVPSPPPCG
jgi:hypothetical protein